MSTLSPVDMLMNTNQEQINRPKPSEKERKERKKGVKGVWRVLMNAALERERFEHRKG